MATSCVTVVEVLTFVIRGKVDAWLAPRLERCNDERNARNRVP